MKKKNIIIIAIVTVCILLVPLIAMQFTDEVNWTFSDFIFMGMLILGAGLTYEFIASRGSNKMYRIAVSIAVVTGFLLTWANLAVGIIGSEDNSANIMYFSVIPIGIVGAVIVRFRADGMAIVAFVLAIIQLLIPVTAYLVNKPDFDPGVVAVFGINAFFAMMFILSGILFKRSDEVPLQTQ